MKGSETGPVIDTAAPEGSTFLKVLQHATGYPAMPKGRASSLGRRGSSASISARNA